MKTELCIPSDLRFLAVVEAWMLGSLRLELGNWPDWPRWENRLRLVLVEAYSNVVRHAHRDRPELPIMLKLELNSEVLYLEIWDQGQGFDLDTYLPPAPSVHQEGGYGWMILNRLMDKVEYQVKIRDHHNCLRLQANLPPEYSSPAISQALPFQ
ncbi:MAG: ATP-binding protein [Leptolyngbya sp. SIO1D8]|nr:ATP-binding protein [Leptolyngbya sp. SIO1D8]